MAQVQHVRLSSISAAEQNRLLQAREEAAALERVRLRIPVGAVHARRAERDPHDWNFPPDFTTLGKGYDLYGRYAYARSTKGTIFDWRYGKVKRAGDFEIPECVTCSPVNSSESKYYFGETVTELQRNFSASLSTSGKYMSAFRGTVSGNIKVSELTKSRRAYSIIFQIIGHNKYSFDPSSATARDCLSPDFLTALDHYPPDELFKVYGTHFPCEMLMGGRFEYGCSTITTAYKSSQDVQAATKASFKRRLFGGDVSASVQEIVSEAIYDANTDIFCTSVGGSPEKAAMVGLEDLSPQNRKKRYEKWLESIPANQVFADFGSRDCLHGIWTLCTDSARRSLIKTRAEEYLSRLDEQNRLYSDRIVDIVVIAGDSSSVEVPEGYEKISYDLNRHVGDSDFIYFCFRKESAASIKYSNKRPIDKIKILSGPHRDIPAPAGYTQVPVDLNKGAGGKFIYLYKSFGDPGDFQHAIRDIYVVGGDNNAVPPPYGYKRIDIDLNAGSGGDFIYLCYTY